MSRFKILLPFRRLLLFPLALSAAAQLHVPPSTHRANLNLDAGWRFIRQDVVNAFLPAFDDSAWTPVDVPHTWNALDGQDGGGNYYRGIGWYRRHYTVDGAYAGRRLFLKFEAANIASEVWVNGAYVGQHQGGYAAFVFDVTTSLNVGGDNVIAVKVNNSSSLTGVAPLSADFNFQGGLYRDVHLLVTDPVQVTPLDYGSPGVYIKTTNVSSNSADVQVTAAISNATASAAAITVRAVITDAATNIVAALTNFLTVPAGSLSNALVNTTIANPHLWFGSYDPYLYRVWVEVMDATGVIDAVSQPLGFRWFNADPNLGFFLNGNSYPLHGVCLHQDWLNKGWALGHAERATNIALIRELGANTIRLAHYQHAEHTYQLADQYGLVLWTEIPLVNTTTENTAFFDNAKQQLRELIRQNLNHPSVVCWGLYNEEYTTATNLVKQLAPIAAQEDPTRPSVGASNLGDSAALNWVPNLVSFNKYYGWYGGVPSGFGSWADTIHANYPTRVIGVSEYGAGASVWQHSERVAQPAPGGRFHPEEWQNYFHEQHWQQIKVRPWLWATHIWNMFDFAVDGRAEGDTLGRNDKGLVTFDRQIRKDAFYWYQANWTTNPMVYITGHTFTNRQLAAITAKVYANCDSVQLWLNGVSKGTVTSTSKIFTWPITLQVGSNHVNVVGTKGGSNVTDSLVWYLTQQPYRGKPLAVPGRIQAEEFDTGPDGLAYHDSDTVNTGGAYRTNEPVDLELSTDAGYGYDVTSFAGGEWLAYTVAVASSGYFDVQLRLACTEAAKTIRLRFDGADLAGNAAVPATGGAPTWQTLTLTNLYLAAGQHVLKVESDTGGFDFNWVHFIYHPAPGAFAFKVNFQTAAAALPAGYFKDTGLVFADRTNGYIYGWNYDDSANTRERAATNSPDKRYDTFIHMQKDATNRVWELVVPNGRYTVYGVAGDPGYTDSTHALTVESSILLSATPQSDYLWPEGAVEVKVADGRLTIDDATNAVNNKLCFLEVYETLGASSGWRYAWFGTNANSASAADPADPDNDGLNNLLEYAFNTNPKVADPTHPWQSGVEAGHLALTFPRRKSPTDVSYVVEVADDLAGPWTTNGLTQAVLSDDGMMQTVKVTDTAAASAGQRFLRLTIGRQ